MDWVILKVNFVKDLAVEFAVYSSVFFMKTNSNGYFLIQKDC